MPAILRRLAPSRERELRKEFRALRRANIKAGMSGLDACHDAGFALREKYAEAPDFVMIIELIMKLIEMFIDLFGSGVPVDFDAED